MENAKQSPANKSVLQDYLLVITPSEEIISAVRGFKSLSKEKIGFYHSFSSKAHITINHYFDKNALFFNDRIPIYRSMAGRIDTFEIKINGFGYFENQGVYTIYAKVDLNQIITTRFRNLKKVFGTNVPQTPHITIARGLSANQFEVLWLEFKHKKFECCFYADEIVVLKTPNRRLYDLPMEVETEFKLRKVV